MAYCLTVPGFQKRKKKKEKQNKITTTREHNQSLRQDIPWVNNMKPHQWYFPWIENGILWVTSHPLTFWWDRLEEPQGTDTSLALQWPPGLPDRGASCCSTLFSPFFTNFCTHLQLQSFAPFSHSEMETAYVSLQFWWTQLKRGFLSSWSQIKVESLFPGHNRDWFWEGTVGAASSWHQMRMKFKEWKRCVSLKVLLNCLLAPDCE